MAPSWMRMTTSSVVRPSPLTDRPAGRSPTLRLAWSSADRAGSASAPRAASTRRSSSPPLTPASSRLVSGQHVPAEPTSRRVTTCWRWASASVPGMDRASTSAVPLELNSSSAPTAPTPMAATGWSWPATVSTAPAAQETTPSCRRYPAGQPAARSSGRIRAGSPAAARACGPDLAGALVDETGPGRQRRLADQVAAQGEDDPLGHAQPGRGRADRVSAGAQPQQLGQAGLARPRQAGGALEGGGESGSLPGQSARSRARRGDRTRRSPARPAARPRRAARRSRPGRSRRCRAPGPGPRRTRPPGRRARSGPRPGRRGGSGRSRSGRSRRSATGWAARHRTAGPRRDAPPTGPRPWTRWCRCRGRRRSLERHGRSSPEPRSMSLAGTWMRSTGRPGSARRARSRAAATRPTS